MQTNEMLELLKEIEENVNTCCEVTMDTDDVLVLIDKLRELIKKETK